MGVTIIKHGWSWISNKDSKYSPLVEYVDINVVGKGIFQGVK